MDLDHGHGGGSCADGLAVPIHSLSRTPDEPNVAGRARRESLFALVALALGPAIEAQAAPTPCPSAGMPPASPRIDVHCHIFNVLDVPAYAFVEDVLIENWLLRIFAAPFATLLVRTADGVAPDYAREKKALEAMLGVSQARVSTELPPDEKIFADGFTKFIKRDTSLLSDLRGERAQENARFARKLYETFLPRLFEERATATSFGLGLAMIEEGNIKALHESMQSVAAQRPALTDFAGYSAKSITYFINRLCRYRFQLADELAGLLPDTAPRLLTPAILEIGNWLPDSPVDPTPLTGLANQAELMHLISLHSKHALVHGFIGFDPWQYLDDIARNKSPNALEIVETALSEHGFIGVKLYPPMGFRATANTGRADSEFLPRLVDGHPHLGEALDKALDALYDCCLKWDVPIMAHCAPSNAPSGERARCADPQYWKMVLEKDDKRKALRLNLGHFGGIWNLGNKTTIQASLPISWTPAVVKLLAQGFPNLYTDFGDFSIVLGRTKEEAKKRQAILQNLAQLIGDSALVRSRIMYGTDWLMLGREPGFEDFYSDVRDHIVCALGMSPENLFWKNAARFLGLAEGNQTRTRLCRFYSDNHRDPAVLDPLRP